MAIKSVKYFPEVDTLEHDDSTMPETKRVLLYGWDAGNLRKVRLSVNSDGAIESNGGMYKTIIDETATNIVYIGTADRGTTTSVTGWKVLKIDDTTSVSIFTWAEGIWDNRSTLTYS